ncbi:SO_0444 family Cu/Zn efflux transporter [bacterium]|nr:SO_0444 family Cu/Zn efflux transporter [candidate division CSSED10-310 bacterium]
MAPYLILGFFVAGALSIWIKPEFVRNHFGKGRFLPVLKTSLLGVPLPLCSCGVIPVATSLRRAGASKGATTAFLLSTPQTGIDSIAVTYSLLGGFFAVFRPLAALLSGLVGGLIVSITDREHAADPTIDSESGDTSVQSGLAAAPVHASCCSGSGCHATKPTPSQPGNASESGFPQTDWISGIRHGFITLPKDIGRALVVGVIIAGVISAVAPPELLTDLPGGHWTQMLFLMLAGIPIYVCATASVPVAAALILKGISPGAALVFLITGPATNAATISTIWKIMGRHTAIMYVSIVAITALLSGIAVDLILTQAPLLTPSGMHLHGLRLIEILAGILLIGIFVNTWRPGKLQSPSPRESNRS